MPNERERHAADLLRTLAYPLAGEGARTSPPVVDQVTFEFPAGMGRASFLIQFTNGVVIAGPMDAVTITNPREE